MNSYINGKDDKNGNLKNDILNYLIHNGNATNNDLAKELGLSVPTVAKIISEMLEEGLLNEYGKLETAEGRKPTLYGLNPDSGYFIGVDINQTTISIGLMNFHGDLVELLNDEPYIPQNTEESLDELCKKILDFIATVNVDKKKLLNICINISGRVNPDSGYSYSFYNFSEEPLTKLLEEKLGYPTRIDNDSRAMTYGEYMKGCVKGESNVLFINLSWGLGMGIIVNGTLYKGRSGFAGELGHVHAFDNGMLCHCGKKGCLETEVSGKAFYRKVVQRIQEGESSILSEKATGDITFSDLIEATIHEDPLCIDIVNEIGLLLGEHVAGLINLFNPELVVIGGQMSQTGDFLIHAINSSVMKYSLNLVNKDTRICLSKLKERAGVVGACMLARKKILDL